MYIGNVFLDKVELEFEGMVTEAERRRHLESLAEQLMNENQKAIMRSGMHPVFFIQCYSIMNAEDFTPGSWASIIKSVGSAEARQNIRWKCAVLNEKPEHPGK